MAEFLWERYNITPHISTISRTLRSCHISRKKIRSVAAERNEELRLNFKRRIPKYDPRQLIYLNESATVRKLRAVALVGRYLELLRRLYTGYIVGSVTPSYLHAGWLHGLSRDTWLLHDGALFTVCDRVYSSALYTRLPRYYT